MYAVNVDTDGKEKQVPRSEYPNHYQLKKNRLIILNLYKWKCEVCGKLAIVTHHKDRTKRNHSPSNLKAVCKKCHKLIHRKPRQLKLALTPRKVFEDNLTINKTYGLKGRTPKHLQVHINQ